MLDEKIVFPSFMQFYGNKYKTNKSIVKSIQSYGKEIDNQEGVDQKSYMAKSLIQCIVNFETVDENGDVINKKRHKKCSIEEKNILLHALAVSSKAVAKGLIKKSKDVNNLTFQDISFVTSFNNSQENLLKFYNSVEDKSVIKTHQKIALNHVIENIIAFYKGKNSTLNVNQKDIVEKISKNSLNLTSFTQSIFSSLKNSSLVKNITFVYTEKNNHEMKFDSRIFILTNLSKRSFPSSNDGYQFLSDAFGASLVLLRDLVDEIENKKNNHKIAHFSPFYDQVNISLSRNSTVSYRDDNGHVTQSSQHTQVIHKTSSSTTGFNIPTGYEIKGETFLPKWGDTLHFMALLEEFSAKTEEKNDEPVSLEFKSDKGKTHALIIHKDFTFNINEMTFPLVEIDGRLFKITIQSLLKNNDTKYKIMIPHGIETCFNALLY
jgi:hypothetical protein